MKKSFFGTNRTLLHSPSGWFIDLKNSIIEKDGWTFKFTKSNDGTWTSETIGQPDIDGPIDAVLINRMKRLSKEGVEVFMDAVKKRESFARKDSV